MGLWDASRQSVHLEKNAPDMAPDLSGAQFHWAWNYVRDQHLFWPWYERTAEARLGIARDNAFPAMSGEDWDIVLQTNLDGFYNVLNCLIFF